MVYSFIKFLEQRNCFCIFIWSFLWWYDKTVFALWCLSIPYLQESYFGKPFTWCMLHNFGDNLGSYGRLPVLASEPLKAVNAPHHGWSWNDSPRNQSKHWCKWVDCWSVLEKSRSKFIFWLGLQLCHQKMFPLRRNISCIWQVSKAWSGLDPTKFTMPEMCFNTSSTALNKCPRDPSAPTMWFQLWRLWLKLPSWIECRDLI